MDRNPYAPPLANVEGVEVRPRVPREIRGALSLLCLSCALNVPGFFYDYSLTLDDVSLAAVGLAIKLALAALLFLSIWKRWRWGRVLYTVVVVLGVIGAMGSIPRRFALSPYLGIAEVVSTLADIPAIILLFTAAASDWYDSLPRR